MNSRDFCFWLQGFFELREPGGFNQITSDQAKLIQDHLALVFVHEIDPSMGDKKHQDKLNTVHSGNKPAFGGTDPNTGAIMRC